MTLKVCVKDAKELVAKTQKLRLNKTISFHSNSYDINDAYLFQKSLSNTVCLHHISFSAATTHHMFLLLNAVFSNYNLR